MIFIYYLTLWQPAGAQSGVQVSQQAKDAFIDLKEGRKHKYVIFNLSPDNREVEVLSASSSTDYDDFVKELPEDQCRWAVYDLEFEKPDGGRRSKLCFFSWWVTIDPIGRQFRPALPSRWLLLCADADHAG
jgi:Cofilin/tropomyosin-type actin-binding protein